ncbi:putative cytochrome b561 [Aphelenchoides fujianensis]|nr:putative cytochrome b561 [Aphelenchoides fujianensis]
MGVFFDEHQILSDQQSNRLFTWLVTASQLFGVGIVISVVMWMGGYGEGGYSWNADPERQFHYHPTFMAMGLIFLFGEAVIVYRSESGFTKLLHLSLHSLAIIFAIVALRAVFDSHNYHRDKSGTIAVIPNLYSLHSWLGLTFVICYCLQFLFGFLVFFFPGFAPEVRRFFMPFHRLIGVILMVCVVGVALAGISERAAWKHTCWTQKHEFCGQQAMSNFFGLFIIGYAATVLAIVLNPRWKRMPLAEEELQRLTID